MRLSSAFCPRYRDAHAQPSPANPGYTAEELAHQLTLSGSRLLVTHAASLPAATEAAKIAGLPLDRVIVLGRTPSPSRHPTVDELVAAGLSKLPQFVERRLSPGEAKTKVAFLCFSSGTTGKPKAVQVSHYAMISNVIQVRLAIGKGPRYAPGDVALGGAFSFSKCCLHS